MRIKRIERMAAQKVAPNDIAVNSSSKLNIWQNWNSSSMRQMIPHTREVIVFRTR
jgi:hypothetical protein